MTQEKIELKRAEAVSRFLNLEFSKEKELQDIVNLAAAICGTPTALLTLISKDTQHIRFKTGFDSDFTPREDAFCKYNLHGEQLMEVPDAQLDERFVNNPLVTGDTKVRFYAGSPITTQEGHTVGSLCVLDQVPKALSPLQRQTLEVLSRQVIHMMEFEASLTMLKEQFTEAKTSEIKLRSFFESFSACHLLLSKDLKVMAFNKVTAKFVKTTYGVNLQEGMLVTDYIHPEHRENFVANCMAALAGNPLQIERPFTYSNGKTVWWSLAYEPAFNTEGEIIGISYNATDITHRIEQEQKVWMQNKSLERIAYIQSHEIRRPVASILGLMNLFEQPDYSMGQEDISMLKAATEELDQKIKTIVSFTCNDDDMTVK